jgi:hypothetical protein
MITGGGLAVVDEAERMVGEVRDDPAGRIRLAADAYALDVAVDGIGPTGGQWSHSCVGSRDGVSSILWTTTCPAARGGAR